MFHADQVIIRLPCGRGHLSRIWKVQCDWLSMGKECCLRLSRHGRLPLAMPVAYPGHSVQHRTFTVQEDSNDISKSDNLL